MANKFDATPASVASLWQTMDTICEVNPTEYFVSAERQVFISIWGAHCSQGTDKMLIIEKAEPVAREGGKHRPENLSSYTVTFTEPIVPGGLERVETSVKFVGSHAVEWALDGDIVFSPPESSDPAAHLEQLIEGASWKYYEVLCQDPAVSAVK